MNRFSPLLWLCAVSAAALNLFTLLDPTGVYDSYLSSRAPKEPALAVFFTAMGNGVYPWTDTTSPGELSIIEKISEPEPESEREPTAEPEIQPETPKEESDATAFVTVELDYFNDALFIGDSHTEGFQDYAGVSGATFYYKNGLNIMTAVTKEFIETETGKITLCEALDRRQFGKIFLLLGINELGDHDTEQWYELYRLLVDLIREKQPNAVVFVQSIFHTTQKKSQESIFKNDLIDERNAKLAQLDDGKHVFYLDVNPIFDDETGALREELSGDGVHVRAPYYALWRDYLCAHGIMK